MDDKKFLGLWDSAWQFVGDLVGAICLFDLIPALMFIGLVFE
jgi:hypothetical protein